MLYYSNFLISMFAAILLIPPLTQAYQKLKILDMPSERKVHTAPIPRVGGVAIVIASIIPLLVWLKLDFQLAGLLAGIGLIFLVGIVDDLKDISYKIKFIVQIVAISLIFLYGFIDTDQAYYLTENIVLNIFVLSIYLLFILGVTNAINLSDGLDGLAGGEALLSFSIIALLAYESQNSIVLSIVLAVMGAVFGFLRFNTYPAKIFMGDTGSLFLGFLLGLLSVALTYGENNAYAKTLPLLIVGLPILDTLLVMANRIRKKQSPFTADRNHIHHRLLDKGFKHYQSVLIIYTMQSVFILAAFFVRYELDQNIILLFLMISSFVLMAAFFPWYVLLESNLVMQLKKICLQNISELINKSSDHIFALLSVLLISYCVASSIVVSKLDNDIAILLAIVLLLSLGFFLYQKNKPCHWIERVAIHVLIVLSIYIGFKYGNLDIGYARQIQFSMITLCLLLIFMLLVGRRRQQRFIGSPMDYLLIAIALVVPNLPGSPILDPQIGYLALKLILLFYCVEFVLFNIERCWWMVRSTIIACAALPLFFSFLS